eukprot:SAG31_NODE_39557_length_287_cov_0.829787_1_plen_22_part_10
MQLQCVMFHQVLFDIAYQCFKK